MKTFFVFLLFVSLSAFANEVKIGCAYTCDNDVQTSLRQISKELGIKLKLIDLSKIKKVDWLNLSGVVIPGGEDIDPKYYLPFVEEELQIHTRSLDHLVEYTEEGKIRDPFEYKLLQEYFSKPELEKFPLLGICRGMQIMAVSLGIPLYVDIKTELQIENRRDLYDEIYVVQKPSLMSSLFPAHQLTGYKYHHQGIRIPYYLKHRERWPKVSVSAFSNNNLVAESMEVTDRPNALGIQFHPEVDNNQLRRTIFSWFLKKALNSSSASE